MSRSLQKRKAIAPFEARLGSRMRPWRSHVSRVFFPMPTSFATSNVERPFMENKDIPVFYRVSSANLPCIPPSGLFHLPPSPGKNHWFAPGELLNRLHESLHELTLRIAPYLGQHLVQGFSSLFLEFHIDGTLLRGTGRGGPSFPFLDVIVLCAEYRKPNEVKRLKDAFCNELGPSPVPDCLGCI